MRAVAQDVSQKCADRIRADEANVLDSGGAQGGTVNKSSKDETIKRD